MSLFVLMAGGTGGHLFPAMALAQELRRRGHDVRLMTDHRVTAHGDKFPATAIYIVPSATPSVRNPIKFIVAAAKLGWGTLVARRTLNAIRPDAVIGFGGYPVFPPFLAASMLKIPGILHEQNSVMGRANRALAERATLIALTFAETAKAEAFKAKSRLVGNPLRDRVVAVVNTPYPALDGELRLLVTGGSQGARIFADLVPTAIAELPAELRSRLRVMQQARPEDLERVADAYRQSKVNVELQPFFEDLPERIAQSHLVISRAGASTITELTAIGRPAIYVPLPGSIDADQKQNALVVEAAGGGWIAEQATLSPQSLGTRLASLFGDPETLKRAAAAAKSLGQPKAVAKLADLAEDLAGRGNAP
jgi:UDP-N-acetylglucosamine--N-acetylmuramyl-(pentapeptide) pyrophosphoryl-undecaprenol N-acetylglucosamine transferase